MNGKDWFITSKVAPLFQMLRFLMATYSHTATESDPWVCWTGYAQGIKIQKA